MSRRQALLSIIVVGALVGACTDEPTAPRGVPVAGVTGPNAGLGTPVLKRNSVKYRDAGMKPATGRSGSASLTARALVGRDGRTTLEVTTGSFDGAAAPGNIDKLQVKLLENNKVGRQLLVRNFNGLTAGGTWSQPLLVGPSQQLQVTAFVSGIDANRTDVVVVRERVKRRPDVAVSAIHAPAKAAPGNDVEITALVSELNGDVGARANCVLYVDKAEVDRANGIWVDAGRSVSCAFRHRFASAGTKAVRVEAGGVSPSDWDESNNGVSASVVVEEPANVLFTAMAQDHREERFEKNEWSYRIERSTGAVTTSSNLLNSKTTIYDRQARIDGATPWKLDGSVAFPLRRLDFAHSSGSVSAAVALTDVPEDLTMREDTVVAGAYEQEKRCTNGWTLGSLGKVVFEACVVRKRMLSSSASADDPPADGQWYSRVEVYSKLMGGDVVYLSQLSWYRYNVVDDPNDASCTGAGPDGSYCDYYYENGGSLPALGSTYSMSFLVAGSDGVVQDARADVALDQPWLPYAGSNEEVVLQYCDQSVSDGTDWDGTTYLYYWSSCTDYRNVASGASGFLVRQRAAPTP